VTGGGSYNISVREAGALGCVQTDSLTLVPLEVTITAEPNCNVNGLIQLTAEASITEDVTFQWQDADGNIISGESTAFLDVTETGTYFVNVTDVNGNCSSSDFIDVLVVPIPEEDLLLDMQALICSLDTDPEKGTIELDPGVFDTYEWRQEGVEGVISTERLLLVSGAGAFVVQLFNGSTCVNDKIVIEDDCRPTVIAPNAFTPNQDGVNDAFSVFPNEYVTEYAIFIFDRWGEMVFQSDDQDFLWDGIYRGQLLPTGTYAYKMVFRSSLDATQSIIEQYGGVTLLK
jgi:gliding motility-associated-like protein